jgi:hypothetical protein
MTETQTCQPLYYGQPWAYAFCRRAAPVRVGYGSDQIFVLHGEGEKLARAAKLLKKYKTGVRSAYPTAREGA